MAMLLTQCAACATELGLTLGKKCGRCSTRYCGPECQVQHWKEGGHDTLCKPIKKAGGAEQYYANNKYAAAVAVAVQECAEDTKGQTCYICTQAVHWKTKEGLVRGCACRGTAGFAHVSCLAEQAKILYDEAEYNNLGNQVVNARFARWHTCSLCEQHHHGVVSCALAWACWKTYAGRPELNCARIAAMGRLGTGLHAVGQLADALPVMEAELSMKQRLGDSESNILAVQNNLASTYHMLGRLDAANRMLRDLYSGHLNFFGEEHPRTLMAASNYTNSLFLLKRCEEGKALLRKATPMARRVLGESDKVTLRMRRNYAEALYTDPGATLDDLRESVETLEDLERTARRVMGGAHPDVVDIEQALRASRAALSARDVGSISEAFEAMTAGDA